MRKVVHKESPRGRHVTRQDEHDFPESGELSPDGDGGVTREDGADGPHAFFEFQCAGEAEGGLQWVGGGWMGGVWMWERNEVERDVRFELEVEPLLLLLLL